MPKTLTRPATSILINRKAFLDAFSIAASVVPTRTLQPILQNVKLAADPDGSRLMATDRDLGVTIDVPGVQVDTSTSVVLPTQRFGAILRAIDDEDVSIAVNEGDFGLVVKAARSKFQLATEDPDLFPDPPAFEDKGYVEVQAAHLRSLIRRTLFATDVESTRYALGGVLMEAGGPESLSFVGTDGRRLAMATAPCAWHDSGAPKDGGQATFVPDIGRPVLPVKAMKFLDRVLSGREDLAEVQVAISRNQSMFARVAGVTMSSRLVEGRFPKYQEVFPTGFDGAIAVTEVGALLQAVEQASIVTSNESRGVDFLFGDDLMAITSEAPDAGSALVEHPVRYDGEPRGFTLDCRYLSDALKTLSPTSEVRIELRDPKSAVVMRVDEASWCYVVMPLEKGR